MEPVDFQYAKSDFEEPVMPETLSKSTYVRIGVDLGQKLDPTAIVVVEIEPRVPRDPEMAKKFAGEPHFIVRALQRLELGTPYPAVVRRLLDIVGRLQASGWYPDVLVDATGVGQPVVDLLSNNGLSVRSVYLNGSDQLVRGEWGRLNLGKCFMVSRLQVLLQTERLHLPNTAEAAVLVEELLNYEIRINDNANAQFGAFRVGVHDDLATALGLACCEDHYYEHITPLPHYDLLAEIDRHPF
jgi:hypothetical protein